MQTSALSEAVGSHHGAPAVLGPARQKTVSLAYPHDIFTRSWETHWLAHHAMLHPCLQNSGFWAVDRQLEPEVLAAHGDG